MQILRDNIIRIIFFFLEFIAEQNAASFFFFTKRAFAFAIIILISYFYSSIQINIVYKYIFTYRKCFTFTISNQSFSHEKNR